MTRDPNAAGRRCGAVLADEELVAAALDPLRFS
jgi:hypothetical protein